MSRSSRKGGDGKVSSESTEETEKIVIEDSAEEESFVIGTVITDKKEGDEEQPEHPGEISTPPLSESTPVIHQPMEKGEREEKDRSRPLYVAKKKLRVEPEKTPDEDENNSSDGESLASRWSVASRRSGERRSVEDVTGGAAATSTSQRPRGYGACYTRVRVKYEPETGRNIISGVGDDGDTMTGAGGDRVRTVTARSWLEGEIGRGGDIDMDGELEDLDEQLYQLIQTIPTPWIVARVLRLAR